MNNKLIEMLYKTIEAKDKIINEQALEITGLKEVIEYDKELSEKYSKRLEQLTNENKQLKEDKKKAIKCIKEDYKRIKDIAVDLPIKVDSNMPIYDDLLQILGDKEND